MCHYSFMRNGAPSVSGTMSSVSNALRILDLLGDGTSLRVVDVARQLGLMDYWRESHTKPDVCAANEAPPFCRAI